MAKSQPPLSTGQLAAKLNVPIARVRRAVDAMLPDAARIGQNRVIPPEAVKTLTYVLSQKTSPK